MAEPTSDLPDRGGPAVRAVYDRVRALVLAEAPDAFEKHYPTQSTVCFDLRRTDDFVYVRPSAGGLTLGFFFGVDLPDPHGLLRGSGRRMRSARVPADGSADADLAALVRAARDRALGVSGS